MRIKMSKQPPPAPTASAVGPCPTVIQIVGRPGTGSLPSTFAPPDHPRLNQVTSSWNEKKKQIDTLLRLEKFHDLKVKVSLHVSLNA